RPSTMLVRATSGHPPEAPSRSVAALLHPTLEFCGLAAPGAPLGARGASEPPALAGGGLVPPRRICVNFDVSFQAYPVSQATTPMAGPRLRPNRPLPAPAFHPEKGRTP